MSASSSGASVARETTRELSSEFVSELAVPPTCGQGCSRQTCPRLRQSQDDVEMLLAKRTQQDAELVRLRDTASPVERQVIRFALFAGFLVGAFLAGVVGEVLT